MTASGVRFSRGTAAQTQKPCSSGMNICGPPFSREQRVQEYDFFPLGVSGNGVPCDFYRGQISSVNLHSVNFSGIRKNYLFFA